MARVFTVKVAWGGSSADDVTTYLFANETSALQWHKLMSHFDENCEVESEVPMSKKDADIMIKEWCDDHNFDPKTLQPLPDPEDVAREDVEQSLKDAGY